MQENGTDFPAIIKWWARKATDRVEGTEGEGRRHPCVPPKAPLCRRAGDVPSSMVCGRGCLRTGEGSWCLPRRPQIFHSTLTWASQNTKYPPCTILLQLLQTHTFRHGDVQNPTVSRRCASTMNRHTAWTPFHAPTPQVFVCVDRDLSYVYA